jgi:glutamine synthetase
MTIQAETKEDVLRLVQEHNVKSIRLWFTDILGVVKSMTISARELEDSLTSGTGFDGSSIEGYRDIDESDVIAMPDPKSFQILPWKTEDHISARMICDVYTPDGKHFEADPRFVLKKVLKQAEDLGYTMNVGPELEYFYFKTNQGTELTDLGGYFFLTPTDRTEDVRTQTVLALEKMGIEVECDHHEVAPSQHEIDLRYKDALTMADQVQTYRTVVKEVARLHEWHATFMPKPLFGENGSGMHTHQSLFKEGKNAMFDASDEHHLSGTGKSYIAGLLKHARGFCAITNQWVNSYKRLVPGYEAPVYLAWSRSNRSALIRIPNFQPGHEKATRVELRSPDPAGNPYLQFAVMLAAGLDGIKNNLEVQAPTNSNIYKMTPEEMSKLNIPTLPGSLGDAIDEFSQSTLMRETLGDHVFERFVEIKRKEWDKYRTQVTKWELDKLLPVV